MDCPYKITNQPWAGEPEGFILRKNLRLFGELGFYVWGGILMT
ncbi:MAG: hypothetical protein OEV55_03110 [candidate division Zixibacteria bacterium]|nr:hypothetical protein [candidate division Zixibacteria bacterium]